MCWPDVAAVSLKVKAGDAAGGRVCAAAAALQTGARDQKPRLNRPQRPLGKPL